ncbi:hypothetical protein H0H81_002249 [Sphagnurus paluster]|uniref:inositol-3-phosphate synthase n=1 Tax=Sphagnurus paluster TaxID=117069 RepID=A0A9P7GLY4_9AGAR|nr:hypothetical protein H0H81_002249 [Sphagnurus paluster]
MFPSPMSPMVHPTDLVIGGWDISGLCMDKAMERTQVLDYDLQCQAAPHMAPCTNSDRRNLSVERQFHLKETSKSTIVDDMVDANHLLYKAPGEGEKGKGKHPDQIIVIKYVPAVGELKRAINEYYSEIFCSGCSVINIFNKCEDSLLTTPLILDLAILTELLTHVQYHQLSVDGEPKPPFAPMYLVLSLLSIYAQGVTCTEVVTSLNRQRNAIDSFLKACIGIKGSNDLLLEMRIW